MGKIGFILNTLTLKGKRQQTADQHSLTHPEGRGIRKQRLGRRIVCWPIKLYSYLISPMMSPSCRYHPSCSQYAQTAITTCGILRGLWMTLKRVLRCHPWSPGGYDPVLPNNEKQT